MIRSLPPGLLGLLALATSAALPACEQRSQKVSRDSPPASSGAGGAGSGGSGLGSARAAPPRPPTFPGPLVTFGSAIRSTLQLPPAPPGGFGVTTLGRFVDNVDEDTAPDITVVEQLHDGKTITGRAYVLHGQKDGTFAGKPAWYEPLSSRPHFPQLRDIDGDGKLDLSLFTDPDQQRIYLRKSGTFVALPALKMPWGCPFLADLDADGRTDLLCYHGTARAVAGLRPLFGRGDGKFTAGADSSVIPAGLQWSGVLRAPGRELVVVGESLSSTALVGVSGRSAPAAVLPIKAGVSTGGRGLVVDLFGQGIGQLLMPQRSGHLTIHRLDPQRLDAQPALVADIATPFTNHFDVDAADLNGDGRMDLLVSGSGAAQVYQQLPDGTMAPTLKLDASSPGVDIEGHLRDVNGDGLPDIIFPRTLTVYLNTTRPD